MFEKMLKTLDFSIIKAWLFGGLSSLYPPWIGVR
jgi:hypothetical protein